MTAVYDRLGLRFMYPENWQVGEEQIEDWPRGLSVQSPAGAFWMVHIYPSTANPDEVAQKVLETMRAEYDSLEQEAVSEELSGYTAEGHNMNFYCLDMVVHAETRCFRWKGYTLMLMSQGETRDFDEAAPVFKAMAFSLLQDDGPDISPAPPEEA